MAEHQAEKGAALPVPSIPTVCIGCEHPDPTGHHIATCAEAQRRMREPLEFTPVEAEKGAHALAPENPKSGDRFECRACDYVAEFVVLDDGQPGEWVDDTPIDGVGR